MKPTRFLLLGALFTLLAMVSWTHVDAATCNETCCFDNCLTGLHECQASCEQTHQGTCIIICDDEFGACNQLCEG
jgi:hypothetical protein